MFLAGGFYPVVVEGPADFGADLGVAACVAFDCECVVFDVVVAGDGAVASGGDEGDFADVGSDSLV